MVILKSLKRFFNDIIKKVPRPEGLQLYQKRPQYRLHSYDTKNVLKSFLMMELKRFPNDGTKKVP